MRPSTHLSTVGTLIVVLIGCCLFMSACARHTLHPIRNIPVDQSSLVDNWIGFNNEDATCYRLILQPSGNGVLYSCFESGTVATNAISHWRVQGSVLLCEFQAEKSPISAALLTCEVKHALLVGTLTGVGRWKEKLVFRRAQFLEKCLSEGNALPVSDTAGTAAPQH
jgi:hypothetical protein